MEKLTYTVSDKNGIHARPAGLIVKTASGFSSDILISCGGRISDCKKLLRLMAMGIKCGEEITISAEGSDEKEAIEKISSLIREIKL